VVLPPRQCSWDAAGREGALTAAFGSLDRAEQHLVQARLRALPASIGLLDYRKLVPIMTALDLQRPVNLLAADAIATAIVVDGRILVRTDAPLIRVNALAVGIGFDIV